MSWTWSLPESILHINYLEENSFSGPKRVPRPLFNQDCAYSNGQHHYCCLHKQYRRHEVGPTVCPTMENPDLVFQETGYSQGPTNPRLTECGNRQAIQAEPDRPNRVEPPPRGLPVNMHQVVPTSNRHVCNKVPQQITSVCVTSSRPPSMGSGPLCFPTSGHSMQRSGKTETTHTGESNRLLWGDPTCPGSGT